MLLAFPQRKPVKARLVAAWGGFALATARCPRVTSLCCLWNETAVLSTSRLDGLLRGAATVVDPALDDLLVL